MKINDCKIIHQKIVNMLDAEIVSVDMDPDANALSLRVEKDYSDMHFDIYARNIEELIKMRNELSP